MPDQNPIRFDADKPVDAAARKKPLTYDPRVPMQFNGDGKPAAHGCQPFSQILGDVPQQEVGTLGRSGARPAALQRQKCLIE
ncbi:hypothetical protein GCM10007908_37570 [Rhizobium albus]|nr:hypothetical protein GCM10007908_37570 [Rhizobium albus]